MKQTDKTSFLVILLLFIQIVLSALIIRRLDNLTIVQSETNSTVANQDESSLPSYIENVSSDDDPMKGNLNAPIIIVEFSDFQCPYCAQASSYIDSLLEIYDEQILFIYRDFPLQSIHPDAFNSAIVANCANQQGKFWEMHDLLFANQSELTTEHLRTYAIEIGLNMEDFDMCVLDEKHVQEINHDIEDAYSYQVSSTPTFFVNGHRVTGASLELLTATIDKQLQELNDTE